MKISKSKKELARIISENGGWRDGGEFSSQGRKTGAIGFVRTRPRRCGDIWLAVKSDLVGVIHPDVLISNWHQTILSRAEYFHLYPEHTETEYRDGVKPTDPAKVDGPSKPTIEQLATNYRNAKDYAERKQREADDAKADADAKLKVLELAGESLGLKVSPITAKQEPELVIEFKVGDEVECVESNIKRYKYNGMVGRLRTIDESDTSTPYLVDFGGEAKIWCHKVKFIRRP